MAVSAGLALATAMLALRTWNPQLNKPACNKKSRNQGLFWIHGFCRAQYPSVAALWGMGFWPLDPNPVLLQCASVRGRRGFC